MCICVFRWFWQIFGDFYLFFLYPCSKILGQKINFRWFLKNAVLSQKNLLCDLSFLEMYTFICFTLLVFKLWQKLFSQNATKCKSGTIFKCLWPICVFHWMIWCCCVYCRTRTWVYCSNLKHLLPIFKDHFDRRKVPIWGI